MNFPVCVNRIMKIERMFSNYEEERLYSTGNDELDELLERAFCEGYEYAQKEFTGAKKITQQLKQWDVAMPLNIYKYIDPKKVAKDPYATKKGRIKLAYDKIRKQNGGVVGKTDEFDKSFYKAKTLSPKRRAVPRNGNERGYLGGMNNDWEEIAKKTKVKK